jgi:sugar phosphate isomerase/epimerase
MLESAMQPTLNRRQFLSTAALIGCGSIASTSRLAAIQPIPRSGPARFRLSLAAYSFRQFFKDGRSPGDPTPARTIDLMDFIDYCAEHHCDGAELTSYYFPSEPTSEFLCSVKRHAFLRGVDISGTAVGNSFTLPVGDRRDREIASVKRWIDRAALLGAPHIRIFAGNVPTGVTPGQARTLCVSAIEECCAYAASQGVVLGLENHGGIVAEPADLLDIVRAVDSPWLGINLDTGNFHTADPYADLAACLPYAVNVQVKVEIQRRGEKKELADLKKVVQILREGRYQGYVALEYEAAEDPWKAVPPCLEQLRALLG